MERIVLICYSLLYLHIYCNKLEIVNILTLCIDHYMRLYLENVYIFVSYKSFPCGIFL